MVSMDDRQRKAKLSLRSEEVLASVNGDNESSKDSDFPSFQTEFGRFNLESTPGKPWTMDPADLLAVEFDMKRRLVDPAWRNLHDNHHRPGELCSRGT